MAARSSLLLILSLFLFVVPVSAQPSYRMRYLTPKEAYLSEAVVSQSGSTAAARLKNQLYIIDVASATSKKIALEQLGGKIIDPLAINDSGTLLGVHYVPKPDPISFSGGTCSILTLDTENKTHRVLFNYSVELSSGCTMEASGLGLLGAINDNGDIFVIYETSIMTETLDEEKVIYSYVNADGKKDVYEGDISMGFPETVRITEKGMGISSVPRTEKTPNRLLFYTPEEGLLLHDLPAVLHKSTFRDSAGSNYLFIPIVEGQDEEDEETILYSLPDIKTRGSLTKMLNRNFLESFPFSREVFRHVKDFMSVDKVNARGQLIGRVTTGDHRIQVALLNTKGSRFLLSETEHEQINDLQGFSDTGEVVGFLQNSTASQRALVVFTPLK